MSASANQGSSWLDVAVPIGPNATSGAQQSNFASFNDGSFTFASSPNPGLTAGLSNLTGGVAAVGQGVGNALTGAGVSMQGTVLPLLVIGGLVWLIATRHK
ncbi:hypothetical protein WI80_33380 [Burkholderia ubonensis]|uniref:hypothetical protein n=1 Tax=Burkholderia ubonensis TaxID=101571 RepID=UPI00075F313F|nr:hypothetical protein [Burkholderia ubonensis]KVD19189.1 hypothetical protein WI80_33380 [Burkholderia ubonensis]KVU12668.1 hypothetical protein WK63_19410 [Burkholderia ubonensis]